MKLDPIRDRNLEADRYDQQAQAQRITGAQPDGLSDTSAYLRLPYLTYTRALEALSSEASWSLELGAGTGRFSGYLANTQILTTYLDVSIQSLGLCREAASDAHRTSYVLADIAAIPLQSHTMDLVASAGALSYANPRVLDAEIVRVLRPGGSLVIVDSLNHNPIFRANRYLHFRRGNRSKSTLKRIPTRSRIDELRRHFEQSELHFFGFSTPALPVAHRFLNGHQSEKLLARIDAFTPNRLAFKFVLICKNKRHSAT